MDTVLLSVGLIPENELSREAGVKIDRRTSGPFVYENLETSEKGIFACGNVLHVHDLVDYVTEESQAAGKAAAAFVLDGALTDIGHVIEIKTEPTVSYTVPQAVRVNEVAKSLRIFLRVNKIWEETSHIVFRDGDNVIARFKRDYMAPGEMENVNVPRVLLDRVKGDMLYVSIEEAQR